MIETLLPNKGNSKTPTLCEIYGNKKRNGWVTINIKKWTIIIYRKCFIA